jgi:hypothetical protein
MNVISRILNNLSQLYLRVELEMKLVGFEFVSSSFQVLLELKISVSNTVRKLTFMD